MKDRYFMVSYTYIADDKNMGYGEINFSVKGGFPSSKGLVKEMKDATEKAVVGIKVMATVILSMYEFKNKKDYIDFIGKGK